MTDWLTEAEWSALRLSALVSLGCTALVALPGVFCGWLLARKRFPGHGLLNAIAHAPLVLPPVVTGYTVLLLLGRNGPVGAWLDATFGLQLPFTWLGATLVGALMGFPFVVRSVRLAVELIEPGIEQAAATLNAAPWRVFLTVTLPLALPGIAAGLILAFARSVGELGATLTFAGNIEGETRTLSLAIYTLTQTPGGDPAAIRLVIVSIVVSLAALAAAEWLARRHQRVAA